MPTITTRDGTEIFYMDWGPRDAQAIVFHHGWPLSSDDWDAQLISSSPRDIGSSPMTVVAMDGPSRPTPAMRWTPMRPTWPTWSTALDLKNAVHIGHSTGGGEVAHYVARAEPGRVAKAVLLDAVPPVMVKKDSNPGGTPIEVFDGYRAALPPTAPSSTSISRAARSTASTGPGAKVSARASSIIGGGRA